MNVNFTLLTIDQCNPCKEIKKNIEWALDKIGIQGYDLNIKKLTTEQAVSMGGVPQLFLNTEKIVDGNPSKQIVKRNISMALKRQFFNETLKLSDTFGTHKKLN